MPVGIATSIVESVKKAFETELIPMVNIWCAHTVILMNAIPTVAATMCGRECLRLPAFAADQQFQRFTHRDVVVDNEHDGCDG